MIALKCENLCLGYEGSMVLKNVNFEIKKGEYFCIVGENGVGKSTLVKAILGLKNPTGGIIEVDRKGIGYLPQMTKTQKEFPASVKEVVMSGFTGKMGIRPFYLKSEKQQAEEKMQMMGIENLQNKSCSELSGGQMQRTLFARALCAADNMLMLDEPSSGLDPVAASYMYGFAKMLSREKEITVVMVTHDIHHALHNADKILHLSVTGHHFFGSPEDYLKTELAKHFVNEE